MIRKIKDIFREKEKTFSLEFFPPKTSQGVEKLYVTVEELNKLGPDFMTVTYGAGGSSRGTTMEICAEIQRRFDVPVVHHFTCVGHSQEELHDIFKPISNDEEATRKAGVDFAVRQCKDLLDRGAPGLHFFALNKVEPVKEIWTRLGL